MTRFVLLYGECEPEILGVFEAQEDGRNFAEMHAGAALAWLDGWRSEDYRVLEIPAHTRTEAMQAWWNWQRNRLEV